MPVGRDRCTFIKKAGEFLGRDQRAAVFNARGVRDGDEVNGPAAPERGHLGGGATMVVAGSGIDAVMDRAEIGWRRPLCPQVRHVQNAKGVGTVRHALIGVDEEKEPALPWPQPAPQFGGKVGAGDLSEKMQRP